MPDLLLSAAARNPDGAALITDGHRLTWAALAERAARLSRALADSGLERGDRVALYMDNGVDAAAAIFGAMMAGGVFLVINPQMKADKLRFILEDSEARVLITEAAHADEARRAADGLPLMLWCAGADDLDVRLARAPPAPPSPGTIPLDLAALIYTSGSTGLPKGVMMTHQAMVFTVGSLVEYLRLTPDLKILDVLPLSFDYGLYQLFMAARLAAPLVLEKHFGYVGQIIKRVREEEVSVFPGVPTIFQTLLAVGEKHALELPTVRRVTNTAAALPASMIPRLARLFPNALIYKMYGLTECKRVCYLEPERLADKAASVGKAMPGTETFLLDPEGRPVPPGETGILHVRGPHVMAGYWKRPEDTERMLRPGRLPGERVLCTQDWFRQDREGFLYFVGRSDDIIKTRGEKVSPVEVENVLASMPGVQEAAVVGVPDVLLGEKIRAYVAPVAGVQLTEHDVKAYCATHLEPFMVPSEVRFEASLPKTTSGKIRKKGLLERDGPECARSEAGAG
ncbi:MAG: acyl--CoA ligase [Deltaproteobacteria bacterium]|nr:acyl--CoA ligase [Deltaproteobacteria bacterium]